MICFCKIAVLSHKNVATFKNALKKYLSILIFIAFIKTVYSIYLNNFNIYYNLFLTSYYYPNTTIFGFAGLALFCMQNTHL